MHVGVLLQGPLAPGSRDRVPEGLVVERAADQFLELVPIAIHQQLLARSEERRQIGTGVHHLQRADRRQLEDPLVAAAPGVRRVEAVDVVNVDGDRGPGVGPHVVLGLGQLAAAVVAKQRLSPPRPPEGQPVLDQPAQQHLPLIGGPSGEDHVGPERPPGAHRALE